MILHNAGVERVWDQAITLNKGSWSATPDMEDSCQVCFQVLRLI